jgi:hypothetical protein
MEYVGFRFPGKSRIHARLVSGRNAFGMRKHFFETYDDGRWRYRSLNEEQVGGTDEEPEVAYVFYSGMDYMIDFMEPAEVIEVEVDARHFAPEPAEWRRKWVNLWFRTKPVDQCAFRRRHFLAFSPVQPLVMMLYAVARIGAGILLYLLGCLLTARQLSIAPIIHPFKLGLDDIIPRIQMPKGWERRSFWMFEDADGNSQARRVLYSPLMAVICALIATFLGSRGFSAYSSLMVFLKGIGAAGAVSFLVYWYFKDYDGSLLQRKIDAYFESREKKNLANLELGQASYLLCPRADQKDYAATLRGLPESKRTFRLRYYELKRSVCRFYAG